MDLRCRHPVRFFARLAKFEAVRAGQRHYASQRNGNTVLAPLHKE